MENPKEADPTVEDSDGQKSPKFKNHKNWDSIQIFIHTFTLFFFSISEIEVLLISLRQFCIKLL